MPAVGVRVEPPVRLGREGKVLQGPGAFRYLMHLARNSALFHMA